MRRRVTLKSNERRSDFQQGASRPHPLRHKSLGLPLPAPSLLSFPPPFPDLSFQPTSFSRPFSEMKPGVALTYLTVIRSEATTAVEFDTF